MFPLSLLFTRFLKLGATAYGGPAMNGQIKQVVVKDYGWIKEQEFLEGIALCQLIPGASMVQLVTYIGYRLRGIWGLSFAQSPLPSLHLSSWSSFQLSISKCRISGSSKPYLRD
jgi:chromate transport protein ChrA